MTKKQKDQQEAIWELLSTEAAYISKLFVIKKVMLSLQAEFWSLVSKVKSMSNIFLVKPCKPVSLGGTSI